MKITFVTHNKNKVREFKEILEPQIQVEQLDYDYPEIRDDDPVEIARHGAKLCAEKFNKTVVVEDSGLFINALKGFPGVCSAYIHKRIGLSGLLKLMEGIKDRGCIYKSAVAICSPAKLPKAFLGSENGTIAESVRGLHGFGHDPIFIPQGSELTYGEMRDAEKQKRFRRRAVEQLRRSLLS